MKMDSATRLTSQVRDAGLRMPEMSRIQLVGTVRVIRAACYTGSPASRTIESAPPHHPSPHSRRNSPRYIPGAVVDRAACTPRKKQECPRRAAPGPRKAGFRADGESHSSDRARIQGPRSAGLPKAANTEQGHLIYPMLKTTHPAQFVELHGVSRFPPRDLGRGSAGAHRPRVYVYGPKEPGRVRGRPGAQKQALQRRLRSQ